MNSQDSNTSTAINYFKNNYLKMIAFILICLILTGILTNKYYKDNELYFSTVKIRLNGAIQWNLSDFQSPHLDILYFLENKNIKNVKLVQNHHANNVIQIEIPHKSINGNDNESFKKIKNIMENYKKTLIERITNNTDNLEKRLKDRISKATNASAIQFYNLEIETLMARKQSFFELLDKNEIYKIIYDGKINIKKAKRQMAKNLVICLMISIILIIFSLWIRLFVREIKKNSQNIS